MTLLAYRRSGLGSYHSCDDFTLKTLDRLANALRKNLKWSYIPSQFAKISSRYFPEFS